MNCTEPELRRPCQIPMIVDQNESFQHRHCQIGYLEDNFQLDIANYNIFGGLGLCWFHGIFVAFNHPHETLW